MTPLRDIARAPLERVMETIIGKSSGVSPTARATEKRSDSSTPRLKSAFIKKTNITRSNVTSIIKKPNLLIPLSNSVSCAPATRLFAISP